MNLLDYFVLLGTILGIAAYGVWRTRGQRDLNTYLKGKGDTSWPVIGLSVLNAVACTFTPVLLVMLAIERLGSALTSQIGMVGPISTILMGVVLLDEPFTGWIAAGTLGVLTGVTLLARWR